MSGEGLLLQCVCNKNIFGEPVLKAAESQINLNGADSRLIGLHGLLERYGDTISCLGDKSKRKSLRFGDRISGHFVQGHVDTTSTIMNIVFVGKSWFIDFKLTKKYKKYLVQKGSITINGVSLTISKILKNGFKIVIIPQTLKLTNLMYLKEKDVVNVEFDVLGKYIKSFLK